MLAAVIFAVCGLVLPTHSARASAPRATSDNQLLVVGLTGKVVQFGLSGFEPDFDPIDRVVISASLSDRRTGPVALPDSQLVLSAYLENFQPDTTPILPDLLHPNQTATSLGGFMQGKAALVNAAGRISYRGSMLAEVFLDNSVHMLVNIQRLGAAPSAPPLRFSGIFTLQHDLSVTGEFRSRHPLMPDDIKILRVPRGHPASWQSVISGLTVKLPKMMGTPSKTPQKRPQKPAPAHAQSFPLGTIVTSAGAALIIGALIALAWPYVGARRRSGSKPGDRHEENNEPAKEATN